MDWKSCSGAELGEPSTMGRAGVTRRPPMVAVRSMEGGRLMLRLF